MRITAFLFALITSISVNGQKYTTHGIVQYQKNNTGNYQVINKVLDYEVTWTFYSDNTVNVYREGSNSKLEVLKKIKSGNKTTYFFNLYGMTAIKIIVEENGNITWLEGEGDITKDVYRIVKKEKANE